MISYGRKMVFGIAATLCVLGFMASPALAGSIFMKNGYIIQGAIVERSDAHVVLNYTSGRVTIQRRFIESVSYEADEERKLEEQEAYLKEQAASGATTPELTPIELEPEDLPSSLEKLMDDYFEKNRRGEEGAAGAATPSWAPGSGDAGATPGAGSTLPVEVHTVSPVEATTLEKEPVVSSTVHVSFRPPMGWPVQTTGEFVQISEPESSALAAGMPIRVNIVTLADPGLTAAECLTWLKDEVSEQLEGFRSREEGEVVVGETKALQVVGSGVWKGGDRAFVRQLLVERSGRVWLVSAFGPEAREGEVAPLLDKVLASFRFSTDA